MPKDELNNPMRLSMQCCLGRYDQYLQGNVKRIMRMQINTESMSLVEWNAIGEI